MENRKKIMILGAGNVATPLIERAKLRGLTTIVVSPSGDYPGFQFADHQVNCDYCDTEVILQNAREYKIDGIACTGTDVVMPTIGRVVDELSLKGTGLGAAIVCADKWLMKQAFEKLGVKAARGIDCSSSEMLEAAARSIGFPLMCKAVDSSGSQGVYKVNGSEELRDAWEGAKRTSRSGQVILEQYLNGVEYGAQAIVVGDRVQAVFLHNDQLTPPPDHAPIGHSIPCKLPDAVHALSRLEIERAIQSLGIRDTIANVDLMLVDNIPYVIEIGARMGATCLPETISIYGGFNAYDVTLSLALGEPVSLADVAFGTANATRLLQSPRDGVLKRIYVPPVVKDHPNLQRLAVYAKPGDTVKRFRVGPDRIGDIIVTGRSAEVAEQLAATLVSQVEIEFA